MGVFFGLIWIPFLLLYSLSPSLLSLLGSPPIFKDRSSALPEMYKLLFTRLHQHKSSSDFRVRQLYLPDGGTVCKVYHVSRIGAGWDRRKHIKIENSRKLFKRASYFMDSP